jgi:hypothetical protein
VTVREHFHAALASAARNQALALREDTASYIVNLLTDFCAAATFQAMYDTGHQPRPLAFIYADALAAVSVQQRRRALQQLGDFALFIAGLFSDSLARKAVDIDYYIGMGESAYACLHESLEGDRRWRAASVLFAELEHKFTQFVDVLAEVGELSGLASNATLMRTYEIWQKTGSARALKRLRRNGVVPLRMTSEARH